MIGLVIDIETTGYFKIDKVTGTLPNANEILEVGYIRVDMDTTEILGYGTLYFYKDYFWVESPAQEVHKITRTFLKDHKDKFDTNLIILNSLMQKTCIIGKNSSGFDIPYIKEFLDKHSNRAINFEWNVNKSKIKRYDGSNFIYSMDAFALDLQDVFKKEYHRLFAEKNGYPLAGNKKGTLSDYVNIVPGAREEVDKLYASMDKERTTEAHGALYDVCMTYVIWVYCKQHQLY